MIIKIQNEGGCFEIGGGSHSNARLLAIEGLGLPAVQTETIKYSGQAGYTITSMTDSERTITMSLDLFGCPYDLDKLNRILQMPCELQFFFGDVRRKITGVCLNPTEPENIIFRKIYKLALQFVCENPYFTDLKPYKSTLSTRTDLWPSSFVDGEGKFTIPSMATVRSATKTIINRGDLRTYPCITVTEASELDEIVIENVTTGQSIMLNYGAQNDEVITFDIENRLIISNINGNVINRISDDTILSEFFLEKGQNELLVHEVESGKLNAEIAYETKYKGLVMR